jgi:hypothetical protein
MCFSLRSYLPLLIPLKQIIYTHLSLTTPLLVLSTRLLKVRPIIKLLLI